MELLVKVLILSALLFVCIQDMASRAVYWLLFPLLAVLFVALRLLQHHPVSELWQPMLVDLGFLFLQIALVSVWFSYKRKEWVNVTAELLGWGDILLLISLAFYLSFLNYLFFYISSLLIILPLWTCRQFIFNKTNKQIPLAGLQAFAMALFLSADWWIIHIDITDDYWLLEIMGK